MLGGGTQSLLAIHALHDHTAPFENGGLLRSALPNPPHPLPPPLRRAAGVTNSSCRYTDTQADRPTRSGDVGETPDTLSTAARNHIDGVTILMIDDSRLGDGGIGGG